MDHQHGSSMTQQNTNEKIPGQHGTDHCDTPKKDECCGSGCGGDCGQDSEKKEEKKTPMDNMHPKIAFFFGLTLGVALMSAGGFFSLLSSLPQTAATTGSDKALAVVDNNGNNQAPSPAPTGDNNNEPSVNASAIKITNQDNIRGDKNAPITVVEFSDLQCPFCKRFHPEVQKLIDNNPGKVRWIYKHFPLESIHPYAKGSAEASECAGEQGKHWEFLDKVFQNQALLSNEYPAAVAKELGLDTKKFDTCVSSRKYSQKVAADAQMGEAAGVSGTPGTFINDIYISGAKPYDSLQQIVDSLLAKK